MISSAHILGQDERLLIECQQGFKLVPEVCAAFRDMQVAAKSDGLDLQIVSSYRGFDRQMLIWKNKWSGLKPILDINEQPIDVSHLNDEDKMHAILTWSALPGASRHHWGTDLDVYDKQAVESLKHDFQLTCSEYENDGPCASLNTWLSEHASAFNFSRPYSEYKGGVAAEPWHLSYQPIARNIEKQLDVNVLKLALRQTDIDGLDCIINNLGLIFKRYVLNEGRT